MAEEGGGFVEYRRLIISEFARLTAEIGALGVKIDTMNGKVASDISDLRVRVGMLEVRCAMFGALASIVVAIVAKFIHL